MSIPARRFAAAILRNPYYSGAAKFFGSHAAALAKALPMLRPYPGMYLEALTEDQWVPLVEAVAGLSDMKPGAERELAALVPPLRGAELEEWHAAWESVKHQAHRDAQHEVELVVNQLEAAGSPLHHRLRSEWGLPPEGDATIRQSEFDDAQERARQNPATFEAPGPEELGAVGPGSFVKVCCGDERFWTLVTRREGDRIWAKVNNDLAFTNLHGLRDGDEVQYETRHAYNTNPPQ